MNIYRYFECLDEFLKGPENNESPTKYFTRIAANLASNLNIKLEEIVDNPLLCEKLSNLREKCTPSWTLCSYLYDILLRIDHLLESNQHVCNDSRYLSSYTNTIVRVSIYGLCPYINKELLNHPCFKTHHIDEECADSVRCQRLHASILVFAQLLQQKALIKTPTFDQILLQFLAGIHSLLINQATTQNDRDDLHHILNVYFNKAGHPYVKCLLIIKSIKDQPIEMKQSLHRDLLNRLKSSNGFEYLCRNILHPNESSIDKPMWKRAEIIANIVGHQGHSMDFYAFIVDEIYQFLTNIRKSSTNPDDLILASISSLTKIYNLPNDIIRKQIIHRFLGQLERLSSPDELLSGIVILDDREIRDFFSMILIAFCNSSTVALPSQILVQYLPIMMHLHYQFNDALNLQHQIKDLCVKCLANRERDELKSILKTILFEEYPIDMKQIHPRINAVYNATSKTYSIQIASEANQSFYDASQVVLTILKQSKHNILIYNVFLSLLEFLHDDYGNGNVESLPDLLDQFSELTTTMERCFKKRIAIVFTLSELIDYKPFHCQFNENPTELLTLIKNMFIKKIANQNGMSNDNERDVLIVILAVIREFLYKANHTMDFSDLIAILREYRVCCRHSKEIENQIDLTLADIQGQHKTSASPNLILEKSSYRMARELCEETQPHLRVYGLSKIIKLLQSDKDAETIANKHQILALTLHCLKDEDSYTFLNCIKVLVALVDILECEVIDGLIVEFQNEDNDTDYRLKIGEVIVKVIEKIGPISFKYKNPLINCFLRGSSNKQNEFRSSSLSNLSNVCRILSYQVHHFFEELMLLIQSIILTDNYVPARRAAIMILSNLLNGIDSLCDFQEILLPIYRMLKHVLTVESDHTTLIHVHIALGHLEKKVKDFIQPRETMTKEINIFNVKDTSDDGTTSHQIRFK